MKTPLLQLALDHVSLDDALSVAMLLRDKVDIVEAGTILCYSEGMRAVEAVRKVARERTLVADLKIADAGEVLAGMAFRAGADWTTVICAAPMATVSKVNEVARSHGGDVQIELFGRWDELDAREWLAMGVRQAIYHRGRDSQASGQGWRQADLDAMKRLSDLGMELSVTGGIDADQLPAFKDVAVKCFIVGRGLYATPDPQATADQLNKAIAAIWT